MYRAKACVVCGAEFVPHASCQKTCSAECGRENRNAYARNYYRNDRIANPGKYRTRERDLYARTQERVLARKRKWREDNPEKGQASARRWRMSHPEYKAISRQADNARYHKRRVAALALQQLQDELSTMMESKHDDA
jgi:hypothetical protein